MALTLRSLGGLSTEEVAKAFLISETTLAQRIVRAKTQDPGGGHPLPGPGRQSWPDGWGRYWPWST